jgi:hypothetical protein
MEVDVPAAAPALAPASAPAPVKAEGDDGVRPLPVYTPEQLKQLPARQYLDELLAPALFEGLRRVTRDRYRGRGRVGGGDVTPAHAR